MFSKLLALFAFVAAVSASSFVLPPATLDTVKTKTIIAGPSGTITKEEREHLPLVTPEVALLETPRVRIHEAPLVLERPTHVLPTEVLPVHPTGYYPNQFVPLYENGKIFQRSLLPHSLSYARAYPRFFY